MSPAAFRLHSLGTAVSAVRGRPGFVPDEYLASHTDADLDYLVPEVPGFSPRSCAQRASGNPSRAATACSTPKRSRCALTGSASSRKTMPGARVAPDRASRIARGASPWQRAQRGQPGSGAVSGRARPPASGARGAASSPASCAWPCGHHRRHRAAVRRELTAGGLVLDCFLGASWHAQAAGILDAVQALIEQGNVDPIAIQGISWTLQDITPFYCPECGLNYCSRDWDIYADFNVGFYDCIMGTCPNGGQHIVS